MIQPLFLGLGWPEIIVILLVVLLLFGGKKIPELMRGAGKGVRAFKDGMKEVTTDEDIDKKEEKQSEQ
ncbi:MAG: twin-arginine translocase TatA/TatE family subunit [Bacteroidaceae bacterium]|jgi:sec-independent protein translocase protein TatA|nr:twin-arginine translocase TatA/TatE family subunit [Bacteroidaceae bacterium]